MNDRKILPCIFKPFLFICEGTEKGVKLEFLLKILKVLKTCGV